MRKWWLGMVLLASGCATVPAPARPQAVAPPPAHAEPELLLVPPGEAPAPPIEKAPPARLRHRVKPGETMYRIAREHGVSVEALARANGIADATAIAAGQELTIPPAESPSPEPATAPPRAPPPPTLAILEWPVHGVLYGRFGKKGKERHDGIDLAAPEGTPVKTAKQGTVLYAGEQKGYGNIAIVEHEGGLVTLYAHNRDLRVKTGQRVREGQVIATVGQSGRTSGPHLHFEVRKEGIPVDPLGYLPRPKVQARR